MKKALVILCILVILSVVLSGCGNSRMADAMENDTNQGGVSDETSGDNGLADEEEPSSTTGGNKTDGNTGGNEENAEEPDGKYTDDGTETKTDSGSYQGQADSNFIEIKISGVPDELASKVFMLSEEIKAGFEKLNLQKDNNIKFEYFENENGQKVIVKIEKI